MAITFALIKERKNPSDKRVVLTPKKALHALQKFPHLNIIVERSNIRAFSDEMYKKHGIPVVDDVSNADVLLGVKEVPIDALIPNKKYLFFSHTIKEQAYNRELLRAILNKKITLYDHETLVDASEKRLVGFGYYAGLVGAYNGIRALGLREKLFNLPKMETLHDLEEAKQELDKIQLPPVKIVMTGSHTGKALQGAKAILDHLKITACSPQEFMEMQTVDSAVYTIVGVGDYNKRKDGSPFVKSEFYENPKLFESDFAKFSHTADMFIACHFYATGAPYLFTKEDARHPNFRIKIVADISCDIDGPVASTIRPSTIANPFYGYDPQTGKETDFDASHAITVMAIDNLPCELPRDASSGFGKDFIANVLPAFFNNDADGILKRAQITTPEGKLTPRFQYLQHFVDSDQVPHNL
jgi:alanine dehydrogenase